MENCSWDDVAFERGVRSDNTRKSFCCNLSALLYVGIVEVNELNISKNKIIAKEFSEKC